MDADANEEVTRIAHMEELREWIEEEEKTAGEKGAGGVISVGQWEVSPHPTPHKIPNTHHPIDPPLVPPP